MDIMTEGKLKKSVVALGTFDGVHLGHQAVIREAVDKAHALDVPAVVYTFGMPPRRILGDSSVGLLTPPFEKSTLIRALGTDIYYEEPLTPAFLSLSPEAFIRDVLVKRLNARHIVTGYNYRFGKDGKGDTQFLISESKRMGFGVTTVPAVTVNGKEVSSTAIREALKKGCVEEAALLLGRPYEMEGRVEHGRAVGRRLGFPTLNLTLPADSPTLCRGVYAGEVQLEGRAYPSMINIGIRPTFGLSSLLLEAHLFGFTGDAYGKNVRVCFSRFLRHEKAFPSPEELIAQLNEDRAKMEKND